MLQWPLTNAPLELDPKNPNQRAAHLVLAGRSRSSRHDPKWKTFPYIVPLALEELGRKEEAPPDFCENWKIRTKTRIREFIVAGRALLEGDREESIAAVNRILASNFQDPEGLFYLSRHLAYLGEVGPALELFRRVVKGGYYCYPAMATDPWLDSLRKEPEFAKLLHESEIGHREAAAAFRQLNGEKVLGIAVQ